MRLNPSDCRSRTWYQVRSRSFLSREALAAIPELCATVQGVKYPGSGFGTCTRICTFVFSQFGILKRANGSACRHIISRFRPMRACNVLFRVCRVFKTVQTARETCDDSTPRYPRRFRGYLWNLADSLPWFGEEPFTAAPEPTPPRPAHRSPPYVRRVLLSFLAGRPVEVAAGRDAVPA
jgi:hypothetical protein